MPKYQVELQSGKKYVVEADSMPTEEEVSLELQKNPDYMKGLSTPTDIFHKSAGENVKGVATGAIGRAKDVASGLIPGIVGASKHPLDAAWNTGKYMFTEPARIGRQAGEGTPEAIGKSLVDTALYIPSVLSLTGAARAAAPTVARVVPKAIGTVARAVPEEAASAAGAAIGAYRGGLPGMVEGYIGGGITGRMLEHARTLGMPEEAVESQMLSPASAEARARHVMDLAGPMPQEIGGASRIPLQMRGTPSNAGGVLRPRSQFSPQGALNMALREGPESVSTLERPQPGFTLSHDARDAMLAAKKAAPTPLASHLSASGADTNFGRTPGAGNAVYRQEGLPSELEQQMMDQERARAGGNRGLTTAATERAMNVHTPGWHDVLLEEPATRLTRPNVPFEEVKFPAGMDTIRERYDYLSAKPVRSIPEETMWRLIDDQMHGTGATNRGVGHATRGKKATGK